MQAISLFRSPWKAGAILGGVGAALLLAVTLVRPVEYRAEAVLHWRDQLSATQAVRQRLSRRALGEVIERQGLYSDERKSRPVENVIESMRKNIRIANVTTGREASGGVAFAISFQHSDPTKARSVVADLQRALDGGQGATAARANPLPVGLMVERPSYWRALWWGAVGGALVGWIGFLVGALQRRRIAARRR
jgi:hypothetical protein